MENYYTELLKQIQEAMSQSHWEEANQLIVQELRMPYIPQEVEEELRHQQQVCKAELNPGKKELQREDLEGLLKGRPEQQLLGVNQLGTKNLRDYLDLVATYLSQEPYEDAASFLIEACIDQRIDTELTYTKDGLEYSFNPIDLEPMEQNPGILKALEYLTTWLESNNPSLLDLCRTLLFRVAYRLLPLTIEIEEAQAMALGICECVTQLMGQEAEYASILTQNHLEAINPMDIQVFLD